MVQIREARRIARGGNTAAPLTDTSPVAQAIQDGFMRRASLGEKLTQVAQLSRLVDQLSIAGIRQRHASADDEMIRHLRAELRLGRELASRVYGPRRDVA